MISIQQIKEETKKQGITQKQLAEELGISTTAIQKWFKGKASPTLDKYEKVLDILKIKNTMDISLNNVQKTIVNISNKAISLQKDEQFSKEKIKDMIKLLWLDDLLDVMADNIIEESKNG
ncbi:helix-turn-helix transcriptional regulator [Francisella philomiragia]|uniref:helix-turn-helix domain-containing protein n=1 Tax=Francisella philomiragia TaxID=28110 RepID=UPI001903CC34|nr:helix-turn-helix transcriptional regulator [Francisella philomiragia]MBK2341689.1 helix-turn-helix transcriptional regulator [Francisella philomiragia]